MSITTLKQAAESINGHIDAVMTELGKHYDKRIKEVCDKYGMSYDTGMGTFTFTKLSSNKYYYNAGDLPRLSSIKDPLPEFRQLIEELEQAERIHNIQGSVETFWNTSDYTPEEEPEHAFKCPECGCTDDLYVVALVPHSITVNTPDEIETEIDDFNSEWDDDSTMICGGCDCSGPVKEFKVSE